MTCRDFCYWLQGYFELQGDTSYGSLSSEQVQMVKRHLNLVFQHDIDPSIDKGDPKIKEYYQKIHDGQRLDEMGGVVVRC